MKRFLIVTSTRSYIRALFNNYLCCFSNKNGTNSGTFYAIEIDGLSNKVYISYYICAFAHATKTLLPQCDTYRAVYEVECDNQYVSICMICDTAYLLYLCIWPHCLSPSIQSWSLSYNLGTMFVISSLARKDGSIGTDNEPAGLLPLKFL